MRLNHRRCPTSTELERAFWSDDPEVRIHADRCEKCGPQLAEIAALADAGREIEVPPSSTQRREELRTSLLSRQQVTAPALRPAPRWQIAIPLAAAAAAAIVWWQWPGDRAARAMSSGEHRATTLEHEGARYMNASAQPDEIVRLVDGTLSFEVAALAEGERFRVITGDAEVEVVGTAFDVTARDDRLIAVRVMHGVVEVRSQGAEARRLTAGETWSLADLGQSAATTVPADAQPEPVANTEPAVAIAVAPPEPILDTNDSAGSARSRPTAKRRPPPDSTGDTSGHSAMEADASLATAAPPATRGVSQQAFDDGWAAIREGKFDDAAAAFERVASSRDARIASDAMYWRAVALARGQRNADASSAFTAFLDAHASSARAAEASVMLGWILFDQGDYAAAKRRFRAGLDAASARVRTSATDGMRAVDQVAD